jgi:integrase/recombinase XerC
MSNKESFLEHLRFEKRYSVHTLRSYQTDLDQFLDYCRKSSPGLTELTADFRLIRGWVVRLIESGDTPRTVNRKITTLKSFYRYLLKRQIIASNPMDKVLSPKQSKRLPAFVEEDRMMQLLDKYEFGSDFRGIRNRLMIEMFYITGMRLSELTNLKQADIDYFNLTVRVLGKRNKERLIPFHQSYLKVFRDYKRLKDDTFPSPGHDFFFVTDKGKPMYSKFVYRVVSGYLRLVTTMEKRSPHILRHTFATHMLNRGADLNAIKEILGHANLSATQVYTHNTFEKLRNIYKQAHPRA